MKTDPMLQIERRQQLHDDALELCIGLTLVSGETCSTDVVDLWEDTGLPYPGRDRAYRLAQNRLRQLEIDGELVGEIRDPPAALKKGMKRRYFRKGR